MRFEDKEVNSLVQSFERATGNNRQPYYDVEDLETIVNYYYDTGSLDQMSIAIEFAILLHRILLFLKSKKFN